MAAKKTTKDLQKALGLRYEPIAFSTLERARSYAARCERPRWVVLGDVDEEAGTATAWVVCPADATKLERVGYEIA